LGFVLGSAAAITFALAGTAIIFVVLKPEYPRLESELGPLLGSLLLFSLLSVAAGGSFYAEIKARAWRRPVFGALLVMLIVVAAYHAWPRT
jgi:hypothetical protein